MLKQIEIKNIRSITNISFNFDKNIVVFCSSSKVDKTTILESIYFISHGKSFETFEWREIITKEKDLAYLGATYKENNIKNFVEVNLSSQKQVKLNGDIVTTNKILSISHPILINEQIINDFKHNKKVRLNLFDKLISIDKKIYSSILNEFNNLTEALRRAKEKVKFDDTLIILIGKKLTKIEIEIMNYRKSFVEIVKEKFIKNTRKYLDEEIILKYLPIKKGNNVVKELLGTSMITVDEDDWKLYKKEDDFLKFSSNEKTKMVILMLVISYLEVIKKNFSQDFPLLLDDIFSKLDEKKQNLFLKIFQDKKINTFITTHQIDQNNKNIQIFNIKEK